MNEKFITFIANNMYTVENGVYCAQVGRYGKTITKFDGYCLDVTELYKNKIEISYKTNQLTICVAKDSDGDIYGKYEFKLDDKVTHIIYRASREVINKYSNFKSFNYHAEQLEYIIRNKLDLI